MRRRGFVFAIAAVALAASPPRRIVSVAPNLTEILYGIGAFPRVVAVTEYCSYPPEAKNLPKVGGWATPSLERIAGFQPDLVVFSDAQAPFLGTQLGELGIPTVVARGQTIQDAFSTMEALGKATGNEREAANLMARTKASLEAVRRRAAGLPHPKVLCIVDRTPGTLRDLYAVTRGSFLAELIEIAGGRVIGGTSAGGYGRIDKETVLTENPDVILDLMPAASGSGTNPAEAWREMPELNAVRRGSVHIVRDDFVPHNSQMIARTAALFARLLHPEVAAAEWDAR